MSKRVREVVADFGISATPTRGRFRMQIIEGDRWGSSGYYSADMIKESGPKAFPKGTHIFYDHPSTSEEWERPERSVRDLVGKIVSEPVWNEQTKALEADMQIFEPYIDHVDAVKEDVGMSIRAFYDGDYGNAPDGKFGMIVESFIPSELNSVDIVTRAGAGGKILQAIESASLRKPQEKEETVTESTVDPAAFKAMQEAVSALTVAIEADRKERQEAAEAAKREKEEAKADPYMVAMAVAEAKLPKSFAARAVEAVKNGADVQEAIKAQQDELEAVLKEVGVTRQAPEGDKFVGALPSKAKEGIDISDEAMERLSRSFAGMEGSE